MERKAEADETEKEYRAEAVAELEKSIGKLAEEHASDGILENMPVADVMCTPTGLSEDDERGDSSTRYSCFVPLGHISGDEYSGVDYYGLINWDSGQMSYGYGR